MIALVDPSGPAGSTLCLLYLPFSYWDCICLCLIYNAAITFVCFFHLHSLSLLLSSCGYTGSSFIFRAIFSNSLLILQQQSVSPSVLKYISESWLPLVNLTTLIFMSLQQSASHCAWKTNSSENIVLPVQITLTFTQKILDNVHWSVSQQPVVPKYSIKTNQSHSMSFAL